MFGSAEADGFSALRGKKRAGKIASLPALTGCPEDFRVQEGFSGTRLRLIWGCAVRKKGGAADRFSAPQGKERAGKMAFLPALVGCPANFWVQEDFSGTGSQLVWGFAARQKGGAAGGLPHPGAKCVPGRWHFLRRWQTARRASVQRQDSPLYGQYRPKTNTPAARHGLCGGGVFMYGNRTDQTSS